MSTKLSEHFSLEELTVTNTGIPNTPTKVHLPRIQLCADMMEVVRTILGNNSIKVNSCYRNPAVNKKVGGVPTSAHAQGYAVDFTCAAFGTPKEICRAIIASGIQFDQLIHEKEVWVHISFDPKARQQVLTLKPGTSKYLPGLH